MLTTPLDYALVGLGAVAAGAVNALAGGGTLISFPILVATGVPAIPASITSTVALCPGYFGATLAQRPELAGQGRRVALLTPAALLGGLAGGVLLLRTHEQAFRVLVPWLILLAAGLLAAQAPLRAWLVRRLARHGRGGLPEAGVALPIALSAVYGGYFGAGNSVIVLAVLGLVLDDTLTRLNALKQYVSLVVNVAAAVFFLFSRQIVWPAAAIMAAGALVGGALGGRLAGRLPPALLRWIVVGIGVVVALIYLFRR